MQVFEELLARQYRDDLERFQGTEQVRFESTRANGDLQIVQTRLITASREPVPIDYTLRAAAEGWRVVDLSVEGVSLVNHYRGTFNRFLVNADFSALLARLKLKLGVP